MESPERARFDLAKRILPPPLWESLGHIFSQGISGCMLVGGTALAGFYAGHRRSDDLDLFTESANAQKAAVLAVSSLRELKVEFSDEYRTQQYYRVNCLWQKHSWTIDVVEDSNLFRVGGFYQLEGNLCVADLSTLLMTKSATLVSRCSEKDLYDLIWIFDHMENIGLAELINAGKKIDSGVNGETLLLSISSAIIQKNSCDFDLAGKKSRDEIYRQIKVFQKSLLVNLSLFLKGKTVPSLKEMVKKIRRLS